jgi:hypothetical protein
VNVSVASYVASVQRVGARGWPAVETFLRVWRSLTWRHWLIAIGLGMGFGAAYGMFMFLYFRMDGVRVVLNVLTRWVVLMTLLACALAVAVALLRDVSRRAAIRPRTVLLTIAVVSAFGSLVADPIAVAVNFAQHVWLFGSPERHFAHGADFLTLLSRTYPQTGEKIVTVTTTVILSAVYYFKDSRTSDALAVAQLGLSRAQRCRLTEELRSAQAALDPNFVFATLADIDRRFASEPTIAKRLLDALIRFLRAALPPKDEAIGTLGQQATLVAAYLEIESVRSAGRVQGVIEVPRELEGRLFAPALILPLVVVVCGDSSDHPGDTEILLKASAMGGLLTVEVRGHGCEGSSSDETEATLASLRERLGALYGSGAVLSFEKRSPRAVTAKIVIDDPGDR